MNRTHHANARFRFVAVGAIFALALSASMTASVVAAAEKDKEPAAEEPKEKGESKSVLRHIVLFKFKDDATKEQVDEVVREFGKLPKKIDAIRGFEWGTDVSVENRSQGFTHVFVVTFADEKGRDEYLPHEAHQAFVKIALPRIDKVLVVDYWTGK